MGESKVHVFTHDRSLTATSGQTLAFD